MSDDMYAAWEEATEQLGEALTELERLRECEAGHALRLHKAIAEIDHNWDVEHAEVERLRRENQELRDDLETRAPDSEVERLRGELDYWNNHFPGEEEILRLRRIEEAAQNYSDREREWFAVADARPYDATAAAGAALARGMALADLRAALEEEV